MRTAPQAAECKRLANIEWVQNQDNNNKKREKNMNIQRCLIEQNKNYNKIVQLTLHKCCSTYLDFFGDFFFSSTQNFTIDGQTKYVRMKRCNLNMFGISTHPERMYERAHIQPKYCMRSTWFKTILLLK